LEPGHYRLVGDASGIVPIGSVTFTPLEIVPGKPATGYITLNFDEPLPDDRFTLTISDSLTDVAGNSLDGETNAAEPREDINLPSGDGSPGGDFVGRFTVDTRAELGVWAAGSVYVDTNGNFGYDPEGADNDDTNEDIVYVLGYTSDNIFAGNFVENASDSADGFHKLGAYGFVGGKFRWMIDTDNNGVPNIVQIDNASINGLPVAGNFDGNADNGDEVVIKEGLTWHFDTDHDFKVDSQISSNIAGLPIVGDFDGNGTDDLGGWADDTFQLDTTGDGRWDFEFTFGFVGVRERPVAADFDGDGIDDLGLWVPDRAGATPNEDAEWYILISDGAPITDRLVDNPNPGVDGKIIDFTPQPFGNDVYAKFGDEFALPVVGNYDPPVVGNAAPQYENYTYTNPNDPMDVNGDGNLTPLDVLWVIDLLNDNGNSYALETFRSEAIPRSPFPDTSGDLVVSPLDALLVVDALNHQTRFGGEGEASMEPLGSNATPAVRLVAVPPAAAGPGDVVLQVDNVTDAALATQVIAYRQSAREEPDTEFLYDRSDAVEELLDDLAEDIAEVWSKI
jgi:hypothetical protein